MIEKLVFSSNRRNVSVYKLGKHSTIQIPRHAGILVGPKKCHPVNFSTKSSMIKFQSTWVTSRDPTFPMNIWRKAQLGISLTETRNLCLYTNYLPRVSNSLVPINFIHPVPSSKLQVKMIITSITEFPNKKAASQCTALNCISSSFHLHKLNICPDVPCNVPPPWVVSPKNWTQEWLATLLMASNYQLLKVEVKGSLLSSLTSTSISKRKYFINIQLKFLHWRHIL